MRVRSCREVTRLVLEGQERSLDEVEQRAVRVHWRLCEGCRHFARHVRLMRKAMARLRE